jgi:hypothetical protein
MKLDGMIYQDVWSQSCKLVAESSAPSHDGEA